MFEFSSHPPLALYVHVPWCVRKCPYCDFNSYPARGGIPEKPYVDALLRDLEHDLPRVQGRVVQTVFIGGGTPSLFSPEAIAQLLSGIRACVAVAPGAEITLEANPGTADAARFSGFRDAGIDRLSIGVQSFEPGKLRALGRIHGRDEAVRAAEGARSAGFAALNLDLIYGLPDQTIDGAITDLRTAMALQPSHLSLYQLTIEPNTAFHLQPPVLPEDDTIWTMQTALQDLLAEHGYRQYEVSAYAQPGFQCRHNLNYWEFGDYLGIGAGAHSKISDADGISRLWRLKGPRAYMAHAGTRHATGDETRLMPEDAAFEFMLNALRLTEGFPTSLFRERTGLDPAIIQKPLREAERRGLALADRHAIGPTDTGRRFLDDLVVLFLPEQTENRRAGTARVA